MESTPAPLIGHIFGKCRLLSLIGKGGMGSVYLAEHLFLKRRVAIKILSRDLSSDPEELARFEKEAIAAARLDHENIVTIHDVDEDGGRLFIVMEYVEGEDLDAMLLRKGALPARQAVEITREITLALEHAHAVGVVHRDIKPGNILVGQRGQVKITDFGLAQEMGHREDGEFVLGTPHYVSPEQVQGRPVDGRSDVYSLGVTLYQMLTGKRPFEGRSPDSVVRKHLEKPRPLLRLRRLSLPSGIEAIVHRMMAVRPEDRYPSARELRRALDQALSRRGINPPGRSVPGGETKRAAPLRKPPLLSVVGVRRSTSRPTRP